MSVNLKIKVTKEILERSKMCQLQFPITGTNCAISLSVRDIFPRAFVSTDFIVVDSSITPISEDSLYHIEANKGKYIDEVIWLPTNASEFIDRFDTSSAEQRVKMPEIEFEVVVPDEVIEHINIDSLRPLLANHPTLQLV